MKIVIDIDNESYEHIKAFKNEDVLPMGWYAICHGTPLTSDVTDINVGNKKSVGKHKDCVDCILGKIRAEIKEWYWQADKQALSKDTCVVDAMIDLFIRTIDKYKAESEEQE